MPRKFRIAVSVFFAMLTAALCVFSARSYFVQDSFTLLENNTLTRFGFTRGSFFFIHIGTRGVGNADWSHQQSEPHKDSPAYQWRQRDGNTAIFVPLLFLAPILALCALIPFGTARFSLRTMFLITTLLAVVLGLGIWLAS